MTNDLISRSGLLETMDCYEPVASIHPQSHAMWTAHRQFIQQAPAVDAVEVGNCNGCYWKEIGRQQKCSCCRRNRDMKDCYRRGDL